MLYIIGSYSFHSRFTKYSGIVKEKTRFWRWQFKLAKSKLLYFVSITPKIITTILDIWGGFILKHLKIEVVFQSKACTISLKIYNLQVLITWSSLLEVSKQAIIHSHQGTNRIQLMNPFTNNLYFCIILCLFCFKKYILEVV